MKIVTCFILGASLMMSGCFYGAITVEDRARIVTAERTLDVVDKSQDVMIEKINAIIARQEMLFEMVMENNESIQYLIGEMPNKEDI